ncbi:MAG: response regulator [Myxococcota bacterium]
MAREKALKLGFTNAATPSLIPRVWVARQSFVGVRKQAPFLVVNDDPVLQLALCQLLILEGYDVIAAEGAEQALALCQQRPPALVLIDLNHSEVSGLELAHTLEQRLDHPPQTIVLSRLGDDATHAARELDGGPILLAKPFQPELLLSVIHEVTGETSPATTSKSFRSS